MHAACQRRKNFVPLGIRLVFAGFFGRGATALEAEGESLYRLTHRVGDRLTKMVRPVHQGAGIPVELHSRPNGLQPARNTEMKAEKHWKSSKRARKRGLGTGKMLDAAPGACGRTGLRMPRGEVSRPQQESKTPRKTDGWTVNEPNYDLLATRTNFLGSETDGFDDHGELLLKKVWNPGPAAAARFRKSGFGPRGPRPDGRKAVARCVPKSKKSRAAVKHRCFMGFSSR